MGGLYLNVYSSVCSSDPFPVSIWTPTIRFWFWDGFRSVVFVHPIPLDVVRTTQSQVLTNGAVAVYDIIPRGVRFDLNTKEDDG